MSDSLINGFGDDKVIESILSTLAQPDNKEYKKFEQVKKVSNYQVKTDKGWVDISEIGKTIPYTEWKIKTQNFELICADKHLVFDKNFNEIYIDKLNNGDKIQTKNGPEAITSIIKTDKKSNMYDLHLDDDSDNRFYTNGILSHNSMWLQNFTAKLADGGYNSAFVTLEMGVQKVMKRIGSMRLKINAKDYDEKSKDTIFMKNEINKILNLHGGFLNMRPGKIFVKKYPTSACTITDLDNYITRLEEAKKLKLHVVIVDYINIMGLEPGTTDPSMLYLKGKYLAEGLRYLADKHNVAIITATQIDKSVWGASDINLNNMPESKAIAETADSVWGIIRNSEMHRNNLYKLKILKLRDGEHQAEMIRFHFNTDFLTMEDAELVGAKN